MKYRMSWWKMPAFYRNGNGWNLQRVLLFFRFRRPYRCQWTTCACTVAGKKDWTLITSSARRGSGSGRAAWMRWRRAKMARCAVAPPKKVCSTVRPIRRRRLRAVTRRWPTTSTRRLRTHRRRVQPCWNRAASTCRPPHRRRRPNAWQTAMAIALPSKATARRYIRPLTIEKSRMPSLQEFLAPIIICWKGEYIFRFTWERRNESGGVKCGL